MSIRFALIAAMALPGCFLIPGGVGGGSGGGGAAGGSGGAGGQGGGTGPSGGSADWESQSAGSSNWLSGVHCPTASTCVAVGVVLGQGQSFILRTTNGGANWAPVTAPSGGKSLNAVHFPDAMTGYAVGGETFGSNEPTILKTVDGGATWSALRTTAKGVLSGIHCSSASTCIAVGGNVSAMTALILKTTDGGATWTSFVPPAATTNFLNGVHCVTPVVCHTAGTYFNVSVVLRTTDGGGTWNKVFHTANTIGALKSVQFLDANVGYAVGVTRVERTTNSAGLWKDQPVSSVSLNGVSCLDANNCLVVGATGVIFKTTNGGSTWFKQESGTANSLLAVHWVDANTAFIVGDNIADGKHASLFKMKVPNGSTGVDVAAECCTGDGGTASVTISGASASNVNEKPMSTAKVSGFYVNNGGAVIAVADLPAPGKTRQWILNMNNKPQVGMVFALPEKNLANNTYSGLSLTESGNAWNAASGTATVNSISGKTISVTVNASMSPDTNGTDQPAVGGFTVVLTATLKEMTNL